MKTIIINTAKFNAANATSSVKTNEDAWYIKAETAVKEGWREVQQQRLEANAIRSLVREELDDEYRAKARATMERLLLKRGLVIKF